MQQDAGGPSPDVASSQKRRAPPPPGTSPGLGPSLPPHKPTSGPDGERAQPVGPSPVAAMIGRELASSSPKVRSPCWHVKNSIYPHVMHVKKYRKKCTVAVSAVYLVLNEESLLSILRNIPFRIKQFKILILTLISSTTCWLCRLLSSFNYI